MILVLDTNVLVAALLNSEGIPSQILKGVLQGQWKTGLSPAIFAEYSEVLIRKKFSFDSQQVYNLLNYLQQIAYSPKLTELPKNLLTDPADIKFLELTLALPGGKLITGNMKHFPISKRQGASVLTPREFVMEMVSH